MSWYYFVGLMKVEPSTKLMNATCSVWSFQKCQEILFWWLGRNCGVSRQLLRLSCSLFVGGSAVLWLSDNPDIISDIYCPLIADALVSFEEVSSS